MPDISVELNVLLSSAVDALGADAGASVLSSAKALHSAVLQGLGDPTFMPKGGWLGIRCRGNYDEGPLAQAEQRLKAGGAGAYASGLPLHRTDSVLAAVLASCGLLVDFQRKLEMAHGYNHWHEPLYVLAKMPDGGGDVERFGKMRQVYHDDRKCRVVTDEEVGAFATGDASRRLEMLGSHEPRGRVWVTVWVLEDGEWVTDKGGPKVHECDVYTSAILVAAVPAAGEERAALVLQGAASELTEAHVCAPPPPSAAAAAKAARAAALNKPQRLIRVDAGHGTSKIALFPGEGLKELKALIIECFEPLLEESPGKLEAVVLVNAQGRVITGLAAKSKDLVCGASVVCVWARPTR